MPASDLDLIKEIKGGDYRAFELLVKRYQNPLFNFIFKYLGDRSAAEDLTQEVFMKIYRAAPQFQARAGAKVSTWIFKIAYNLSMNEMKRRKRYQSFQDRLHNKAKEIAGQRLSETTELRELEKEIMGALSQLPENQRAALLLRVNEGLSYREISEVLSVSIPSVEALVFRARKGLREHLSKEQKE